MRVLIAPLDWGLGHATRCIPIIRRLLKRGHHLFLAGEGAAQALLQQEFPQLPFLHLPGYRIQYGASALQTGLRLIAQLPKIQQTVAPEGLWLQQQMATHHFDIVISDNRYGLHHPEARSVFVTHQLSIKAPLSTIESVAQAWMYGHIKQFDCCWVPDVADEPSLAGRLSHPGKKPPVPVRYIGPLSRLKYYPVSKKNGLLLLLSGPEPQRTIFERLLLQQVANATHAVTLVRGLPTDVPLLEVPGHVTVYNHLPSAQLNAVMGAAELVICRSGYSTVMDLAALQQKALLVPTPGQTEQEYLAKHLAERGFAPWVAQQHFHLRKAMEAVSKFTYSFPESKSDGLFDKALDELETTIS